MQRLALFVLAVAAVVSANEFGPYTVENIAEKLETDVPTVQGCLNDAGTTVVELAEAEKKWTILKDGEEIDEETKTVFTKHNSFLACMLEKENLMVDSKLVLDKVVALLEHYKDEPNIPTTDALTDCVTSLNDNNDLTREDRALGVVLCVFPEESRR